MRFINTATRTEFTPKPYEAYRIESVTLSNGDRIPTGNLVATAHEIEVIAKVLEASPDPEMCADIASALLPDPCEDPLIGSVWADASTLIQVSDVGNKLLALAHKCRDARLSTKPPRVHISGETIAQVMTLGTATRAIPRDEILLIGIHAQRAYGVDQSWGDAHFVDGITPVEMCLLEMIYAMNSLLEREGAKEHKTLTATNSSGERVNWAVCLLRIKSAIQAIKKGLDHTEQQDREGKFNIGASA